MSAAHHDDHAHDDIGYHATLKGYATGFVLSVILTAIPFWLVMAKVLPPGATKAVVLAFAAVQVLVHMVYFLHLNAKVEGGWTMLSTIFTIIVVVIMLAGSVWVMLHMNANMMPMDPQTMRHMP
jgi:cytochrome o ubiquinol oxidase operon protein cyoD